MAISIKNQQSGFALVLTVIFMLVLSIISAGAMRNGAMEQGMANNMQDLNHAFQLAESGIALTFNKPGILDVTITADSPNDFDYSKHYDGPEGPPENPDDRTIKLKTSVYYKGEGTVMGRSIEEVSSLDRTALHIFHITSTGIYNDAVSIHEQGISQLGPKTK